MHESPKVYHLRPHMGPVKVAEDSTCRVYMSLVCRQYKARKIGQAIIRLSSAMWMTIATYMWLAPLAYLERGYMAYGGECLVAVLVGMVTYYSVRRWRR